MTFAELVRGDSVFLDANTFVYHFEPHAVFGPPCTGRSPHTGANDG